MKYRTARAIAEFIKTFLETEGYIVKEVSAIPWVPQGTTLSFGKGFGAVILDNEGAYCRVDDFDLVKCREILFPHGTPIGEVSDWMISAAKEINALQKSREKYENS